MPNESKFNRYKRDDSERAAIFEYSDRFGIRAASEKFGLSVHQIKGIRRRYRTHFDSGRRHKGTTAESYRVRCLRYAKSIGFFGENQLDFASYAVIQLLERGLKNPEWALAEYNRELLGRSGHKKEVAEPVSFEVVGENDSRTMPLEEPDALITFPKGLDGMLTQLIVKYGFSQVDLADMMGITNTAIAHRISPVIEKMRKKYSL